MTKTSDLRRFGLTLAALFLLFGTGIPFLKHHPLPVWPLGLAIVLIGFALALPRALAPVQSAWNQLGHGLGFVNTRILLGGFYFIVIVPLATGRRLFGHDKMNRKLEPDLKTYRVNRGAPPPRAQLERTF